MMQSSIDGFSTASQMLQALRQRQLSAVELLALHQRRIERYNPRLNAIVTECFEQAREAAEAADAARARGADAPLLGLPITLKESINVRGLKTTAGLPAFAQAQAKFDAPATQRMQTAGAVLMGKTNVPPMLSDWQSDNEVFGRTNNPWDLTRTPGGSTGGGAAALAAGLGSLTLGSDIGGSIRVPAHFCGVYGHKPSLDLVSNAGHQPGPWDGSPGVPMDLAVAGPLARSANDLALALRVLGGPNGDEAKAWTWRLPAPRHKQLKDFRVGYMFDDTFAPVSSDIARLYEKALDALGKAGAKLERGWP